MGYLSHNKRFQLYIMIENLQEMFSFYITKSATYSSM